MLPGVTEFKEGGPLVPPRYIKPGKISKIERTTSLALIMKILHANPGENRINSKAVRAASVKHKY